MVRQNSGFQELRAVLDGARQRGLWMPYLSLWSGWQVNCLRAGLFTAGSITAYEATKSDLIERWGGESPAVHAMAGLCMGIVGVTMYVISLTTLTRTSSALAAANCIPLTPTPTHSPACLQQLKRIACARACPGNSVALGATPHTVAHCILTSWCLVLGARICPLCSHAPQVHASRCCAWQVLYAVPDQARHIQPRGAHRQAAVRCIMPASLLAAHYHHQCPCAAHHYYQCPCAAHHHYQYPHCACLAARRLPACLGFGFNQPNLLRVLPMLLLLHATSHDGLFTPPFPVLFNISIRRYSTHGGIGAFYKGTSAAMARSIPACIMFPAVMEHTRHVFGLGYL